jgi:HSP20 family protein
MSPFYPFTGVTSPTVTLSQLPIRSSIVDLVDEGDHYVVTAELPGFSKDQVDVQINKDGLLIRAEQKAESEQKTGKNYLHRERAYSAFERIVEFPEEVNPSKVEGSMKDGVLQLNIPKKEPKPEERLTKVQLK